MKAISYTQYGSPDVIKYGDGDKPVPNDDQILVKVVAASINPYELHHIRGEPYVIRPGAGWLKPIDPRLGVDMAGIVESVGSNLTERFKIGDEVFGPGHGTLAEFALSSGKNVVAKPANVTFEQAAATTMAALTALQGLRMPGHDLAGQQVLINGAAGGIGTFAVQIAKTMGGEVTGVCSTRNLDLAKSLGADHVIDYTKENFTRGDKQYDLIFDTVGNHSALGIRRALKPEGMHAVIGGPSGKLIGPLMPMIQAMIVSRFVTQKMQFLLAEWKRDDVLTLQEMLASGKIVPVIDRTYPLSDTAAALHYLEKGHARGKVIIKVA